MLITPPTPTPQMISTSISTPQLKQRTRYNPNHEFTPSIISHIIGIMQKVKYTHKNIYSNKYTHLTTKHALLNTSPNNPINQRNPLINWTQKDEFLLLWLNEVKKYLQNKKYTKRLPTLEETNPNFPGNCADQQD